MLGEIGDTMSSTKKDKLLEYINDKGEMYLFAGIVHQAGDESKLSVTIFKTNYLMKNIPEFMDKYNDDLVLKSDSNIKIQEVNIGDDYLEIQNGDNFLFL